jgi:hypothetical protein
MHKAACHVTLGGESGSSAVGHTCFASLLGHQNLAKHSLCKAFDI